MHVEVRPFVDPLTQQGDFVGGQWRNTGINRRHQLLGRGAGHAFNHRAGVGIARLDCLGNGAIARFAEIKDRNAAEALRGKLLSVPRSELPPLDAKLAEAPEHRDRCWLSPEEKRAKREVEGRIGLEEPEAVTHE